MSHTLPAPESQSFCGQFEQYVHAILARTLPDLTIRQFLRAIFRSAIQYNHQQSMSFLLFQVPWFTAEFAVFGDILEKLLKCYRGKGKEYTTVCFTLLSDGYITAHNVDLAIDCTLKLLEGRYDHQTFLNTLKETFPHKNRPLQHHLRFVKALTLVCDKKPCLRSSILEIILQKLSTFDTQIKNGDQLIGQPFVESSRMVSNDEPSSLQVKLDSLILMVLQYVEGHTYLQQVTEQLLLIFHKKVLLMDQNKYIQYIMYYVSENNKEVSGYFLSIMLNTLIEHNQVSYRKAYINNVFYLGSYLVKSKLTHKKLRNCVRQIIQYAKTLVADKAQPTVEGLLLNKILQENEHFLYIYQTLLYVFAHKPRLFQELSEEFQSLLEMANKKCCADILVNSEILHRFNKTCRDVTQSYLQPDSEYMSFQNKFNPVYLPRLREKMQSSFQRYSYESIYETKECSLKRKRQYVLPNRIEKKLKGVSEQHISDTSTQIKCRN